MYYPITLHTIILLHSSLEEKFLSKKLITTRYLFIIPLEIIFSIDNSIKAAKATYGF